jgi:hypothetical protein
VDSETEYWLQAMGLYAILAFLALGGFCLMMWLAGIRTLHDLMNVEKVVGCILMFMNGALALVAGTLGTAGSLLVLLFCDNAPASDCLAVAFSGLLFSGISVALSTFALVAMLRKDDRAVWYLYLYPVLMFTFANWMCQAMPILTFAWTGFMGMSLLGDDLCTRPSKTSTPRRRCEAPHPSRRYRDRSMTLCPSVVSFNRYRGMRFLARRGPIASAAFAFGFLQFP